MKEFMLLIRNTGDSKAGFSPEVHKEFVQKCEVYIGKLKKEGKLVAAQPLVREGKIISGTAGAWNEKPFYVAKDMDEAIAIAKGNPEFEYTTTASIEVRPIKMKEEVTGFTYPKTV